VNVFVWHVHGAYTTALVQGDHRYLIPTLPERGAWGRGRADSYRWPENAVEVSPEQARAKQIDAVIMQRPQELDGLVEEWLGRRPGKDVPAIYLEHSTPQGRVNEMRHPAADRGDLTLVHVTHFNALFWESGATRVRVIEHGIPDPGHRYTGELPRGVAAINEPGRRARVAGVDLLPVLGRDVPIDLYGMQTDHDLSQADLHAEMAERRFYVHPYRWTSLGLTLLEAMALGLPVVAVATTEVPEAVPAAAGFVSNRIDALREGIAALAADQDLARRMGEAARSAALARYGLQRFLSDWDRVLEEVAA
jgi:glycosyltransferase involved in cell wall biosynthesis